jgi:glucokinase
LKNQYYIALDIGGTKTAVSLWEEEKTLLKKIQFPTVGSPEMVMAKVLGTIEILIKSIHVTQSQFAAVGISCGGPLDSARGLILSPPNLPGWDAVHIVSLLQEKIGIPCFLENDANACALAEWYWGAGQGYQNLAFLTFGTGFGCGLILNGQLYRGTGDLAGEVGHIRIAEDGPEGYGKRGSWEGYCSGGGISRLYGELTGRPATAKDICEAAIAGEPAALEVINKSAFYLGRGLSILIDTLNPQCIIIGSIFARCEGLFRPIMESIIAAETIPSAREQCVIRPAQLGELLGDKAALGVAINGLDRYTTSLYARIKFA